MLAAATALLVADFAAAQIPTSTQEIRQRQQGPSRSELAETDAVFRDVVHCLIRYHPGRARNLLETVPGSRAETAIIRMFQSRMQTCYDYPRTGGRALVWPMVLLRGIFAESFNRRDFPAGLRPATGVAPETLTAWTRPRHVGEDGVRGELVHAMARCVVARRPADVDAVLRTAPASDGEIRALRALQQDLAACLDTGATLDASPQSLRGLLAEAALHYAADLQNGFAPIPVTPPRRD